ncbi:MAG TPA: nitroreductase family deazaflavin-dependent oxidoreductase [Actinobacteria bacterium]|jgi:deazaflavin-dependent oxidoreductase (nitroreductase family)|nr:nitroreductase family deazaflavin-dependent oxidoreductase [Actinomycetota bacterium]
MPFKGEYEASTSQFVADQVATYEASGGKEANTLRDTGIPITIVTMMGAKSGKVRKIGLMRVEHDGEYALVASAGGSQRNPGWYLNLMEDPNIMIQDGPVPLDYVVREVQGVERNEWWQRAVEVFPPYDEYAGKTGRLIPVLVASAK